MLSSSEEEIRHLLVETLSPLRTADAGRIGISTRKFMVPKLNVNAQLFYQLSDVNGDKVE